MIINQTDINRFYSHIITNPLSPNICWITNYKCGQDNYPRFSINGKSYRCNRISYIIHNNFINIDDLFVRHLCHNKLCINPSHLDIGTHQDNVDDTVNDGLQLKGSSITTSKLDENIVKEILIKIYNGEFNGKTVYDIGTMYSISHQQIRAILNGTSWKHVTDKLIVPLSSLRNMIIGRHLHSEVYRHPTKLTDDMVIDIKLGLKSGLTSVKLSSKFNVSMSSIDQIRQNKTWKHITV